jgi:DNA-binding CsgD family transcriptional regulator
MSPARTHVVLYPQQHRVLRLWAQGYNGHETAVEMGLAPQSVYHHRRRIRRKLLRYSEPQR